MNKNEKGARSRKATTEKSTVVKGVPMLCETAHAARPVTCIRLPGTRFRENGSEVSKWWNEGTKGIS